MIRVAVDVTSLLGRHTGVGSFTREVVRRLAPRTDLDVRLFAVTWRGRGELLEQADDLGLPADAVAQRPLAARPARELWKRVDAPPIEWWTGPVDVVWGPNFVVPPTRRAARVVTVHDLTPLHLPELCTRDTLDYPVLIRRAAERGALVHTDSEAVADEVRAWLGLAPHLADRVVPIPLGVVAVAGGEADAGRRRAGARDYVLALGTVEPRKDLPTLVTAFDLAAAERPDLHLVVAGPDGWGVEAFEAAVARARHRDRIRRLGWVGDRARADLLAGARALAYPSRYEGFGLPPLEAMAAGVPVVTSDLPVLEEVTGDAALHVPVGDPAALARALVALDVDSGLRDRLSRRGPARAARFSWDACAAGIAGLLRRAAAERGRHRPGLPALPKLTAVARPEDASRAARPDEGRMRTE